MQILKLRVDLHTGENLSEEIVSVLATNFFPPEDGLFPEERIDDFGFPETELFEGVVVGLRWCHVREAEANRYIGTNAWGVSLDPSDFVE